MRNTPSNQFDFNVYDILTLCGVHPTGTPTRKGELDVECPCGRKSSKGKIIRFGVNIQYGTFKCFGECSDCVNKGGMLDLYNLLKGRDSSDRKGAYKEVIESIGAAGYKRQTSPSCKQLPQATMVDVDKLDSIYRFILSELKLNKEHYDSLIKRGLTDECIEKGMFKSIPSNWNSIIKKMLSKNLSLIGVPGFYCEKGVVKSTARNSGFFIPYFTHNKKIAGLQIRFDVSKGKGTRYLWFSSAGYKDGCSASNVASFGIPDYMDLPSNRRTVFVTEGALKSYVANTLDDCRHPFIAIAGVNCINQWESVCKYLEENDIRFVVDAFDSDRESNAQVERAIQKLYKIANEHGIIMRRLDWGTQEKGVDDFLLSYRKSHGFSRLEEPRMFVPPILNHSQTEVVYIPKYILPKTNVI